MVKPMCVCEINSILPFSQSTISGHLKILKEADLVIDKKDGLWVNYILNQNHSHFQNLVPIVKKILSENESLKKERKRALVADRNIIVNKIKLK